MMDRQPTLANKSPAMKIVWGDYVNLGLIILVCITMLYPFLFLLLLSLLAPSPTISGILLTFVFGC